MFQAAEAPFDLAIVSLGLENYDGLRLCSHLRSLERTRNLPLLAIADADDNARLMRGLEIGVNDYLIRPIDQNELLARVRTQVKKKRYAEKLRDNVQMSIEAAITDALTGLHNRRYMETHLGTLVEQAAARGRPLSILVLDIDFFKAINDGYGHSAGDDVLKEFSRRLKKAVRGIDLACRFGGEEFVVVMPDTSIAMATMVAERLRKRIAAEPFRINQNTRTVQATISIGIAAMRSVEDRPSDIIRRADEALYRAKREGRNRVRRRRGVSGRRLSRSSWPGSSRPPRSYGMAVPRRRSAGIGFGLIRTCSGVHRIKQGAERAPRLHSPASRQLLDLGLAELDVLLGDGVVLLLHELVGLGARVLLGDVEIAGVGARQQLDLDHVGLGHGGIP